MKTLFRLLVVVLALALPERARAQHYESVTLAVDSIRRETCRGGTLSPTGLTCSKALYTTRVTVIRRLANRLDSLEAAWVPPAPDTVRVTRVDTLLRTVTDTLVRLVTDTVYVPSKPDTVYLPSKPDTSVAKVVITGFDYTTTGLWPAEIGTLPGGAGTVCASVIVQGVWHLGDRAVYATVVSPDSVMFTERPERTLPLLRPLCKAQALRAGVTLGETTPLFPVTWESSRVTFADKPAAIPTPKAVTP